MQRTSFACFLHLIFQQILETYLPENFGFRFSENAVMPSLVIGRADQNRLTKTFELPTVSVSTFWQMLIMCLAMPKA